MEDDIKVTVIDENAKVHKFLVGKVDYFHCKILGDYILDKYSKESTKMVDFRSPNSEALFLRENNEIVFLNTTDYDDNNLTKYGKTGIVVMPDEITKEQKEMLSSFKNEILDFNEIQVWYDFTDHANCRMLITKKQEQIPTLIDQIIQFTKTKGKTR